jgi:uncharacterized protein
VTGGMTAISLAFVAYFATSSVQASAGQPAHLGCSSVTKITLDEMMTGDFSGAAKNFSRAAAAAHPAESLRDTLSKLVANSGQFVRRAQVSSLPTKAHDYLLTRLEFRSGNWTAITACDAQDHLSYLEWAPASDASERISRAQAITLPDGTLVRPTSVQTPWGPLPANLTLPAGRGPFPGVVLVSGAGSQDQDASVGPSKPFADLAEGLASAGIATLRYEKRSRAYPAKAGLDADFNVDDDVTVDAESALSLLMKDRRIDRRRVFLLGHSLGAMMAPRIALQIHGLAGVIMMAAPSEDIITNGLQQTRYIANVSGTPEAEVEKSVTALKQERQLLADAAHHDMSQDGSFSGMPQSWWLSLARYDQVAAASKLHVPLLFLQGEADFQVQPKYNFIEWRRVLAGRPNVKFIEYPALSHPFLPAANPPSPADYEKLGHVPAKVIQDIASWILRQRLSKG